MGRGVGVRATGAERRLAAVLSAGIDHAAGLSFVRGPPSGCVLRPAQRLSGMTGTIVRLSVPLIASAAAVYQAITAQAMVT